ncbi:hypothetical protein QF032_001041 [Streptomyces achromogenes]|uniref:Uncharacterized protein n=1 Tax=Streptomyces achromogenes TaxID=67255 RepID=A0ABU0PWQ7_STRAH|nr:hypothetical protein [Streptomyces achromogenes]MDQ0682048.1 hypothetical protein [Streptomyces achromogenes]MDQ0829197.1 hypothetical protein [Streptomyces achromogenes]
MLSRDAATGDSAAFLCRLERRTPHLSEIDGHLDRFGLRLNGEAGRQQRYPRVPVVLDVLHGRECAHAVGDDEGWFRDLFATGSGAFTAQRHVEDLRNLTGRPRPYHTGS